MDKHGIKLVVMALGIVVCLVAAGCLLRTPAPVKAPPPPATTSPTVKALSALGGGAEAMAQVAVNVRWFFYAGAAMAAGSAVLLIFRAFGTAAILFVMVVTRTLSFLAERFLISSMRSSTWLRLGRTSTGGSRSPVGLITWSTNTPSLFSISYSAGVALMYIV